MNGVREFVNQDVFRRVRIIGKAQQILFGATDHRVAERSAQPARPAVPENFRLQVAVLGHVGRVFVQAITTSRTLLAAIACSRSSRGPTTFRTIHAASRRAWSETFAEPTMGNPATLMCFW
jgi:hypothetical protein